MFREDYKKKYDSISPDPAFRLRLEERIEDMKHKKKGGVMRRTAVAALAAMLVLTAAGFASGTFRSIFAGMINAFDRGPTVDYEHMETVGETDMFSQTIAFENGVTADVRLEQSYYNGQQLAMSWSIEAESKAEFLEKDDARVAASEEGVMAIDLEEKLGTENAAEFARRFEAEGWAGAAWYECYLGDSSYLADAEKIVGDDGFEHPPQDALFIPETDVDWLEDGVYLTYDEFETPLPEAAQDRQSVKIARNAVSQMCWLIVDGDKVYTGRSPAERVELVFEIERSEDYAETVYTETAQFPNHAAVIELSRTPIRAGFSVVNQISDEWRTIWADYSGYLHAPLNLAQDVIFDYEIYIDGTAAAFDTESFRGAEGMSGWFLLPADAEQVVFRPVYANTGAHADEDVVIDLAAKSAVE